MEYLLGVITTVVLCVLVGQGVHPHIVLTYPPARKYALDFLDNVRTIGPCGMRKGLGPVTDVISGSEIDVTWHIAYVHTGGFYVEILDSLGNTTHRVPASGYHGSGNTILSRQKIRLPQGLVCRGCTLRVVRQALDWSTAQGLYLFWSCADINIVPPDKLTKDAVCLNGGTRNGSVCRCQRRFSGENCQFEDDCSLDMDCHNHGKCRDTKSTSYPVFQCFCYAGWFGKHCQKQSQLASKMIEYDKYTHTALSSSFSLYHRVLTKEKELEIVLRVKSQSWVAIGIRPKSNVSCRSFSQTEATKPVAEPEKGTPEPEKGTPEPEKGTPEPEKGTPQPEKGTPEPEKGTPEPEKGTPEPEKGTPEPEKGTPEPEKGTPEPEKGTPEPEKGTPEPEKGTPEPEKGTPEPEKGTPEPEKGTPEPEKGTPEPEKGTAQPEQGSNRLHPMDCIDIVLATADGDLGRVGDYYTQDRSTPKRDEFYGGKDSLTSAMAFEDNNYTVVIFRKPLKANEDTDYDIVDEDMHIAWAWGQETRYYRRDELKFHGVRGGQAGVTSLNFLAKVDDEHASGQGSWDVPEQNNFRVRWTYVKQSDRIDFEFSVNIGSQPKWVALGFSDNKAMVDTDAVVAWVNSDGSFTVSDRWIKEYAPPHPDHSQDVFNTSASMTGGTITVTFSRYRQTNDINQDYQFSDNKCPHVIHAVGGQFNSATGNIRKHQKTPYVSKPVCFKAGEMEKTSPGPRETSPKQKTSPEPGKTSTKQKTSPEPGKTSTKQKTSPEPGKTSPTRTHTTHSQRTVTPKTGESSLGGGNWMKKVGSNVFKVKWTSVSGSDEIDFTFSADTGSSDRWIALGFSDNKNMEDTDAVIAWVDGGVANVSDRWIKEKASPYPDSSQDITNVSVTFAGGTITVKFRRPRQTDDIFRDFQFNDTNCPYVIHAVGGRYDSRTGRIRKHPVTPVVSDKRICMNPEPMTSDGGTIFTPAVIAAITIGAALVTIAIAAAICTCLHMGEKSRKYNMKF